MSELQKQNDAELIKMVQDKREELRKLRFGTAGSSMRNSHAMRNLRREVAQALTELTRRGKVGA